MSKKIKKGSKGGGQSEIRPTPLKPKGVSFSFKYLKTDHKKFNWNDREISYWITLLDRLKNLSGLTAVELKSNSSKSLRCHPIDWNDTSENGFGIPDEEQVVDTPYQFSLSSNEHGRVHGFFIGEVFYAVWLDPNHCLYP
ncbi:hypothetical protein ACN4EG_11160 [Alkalinema pantanalense CENA528]|uniref:hypothetical protein n=1 Tax=Alkalinema pantanalense TaxID=1620705 RepID=UPI003D6E0B83